MSVETEAAFVLHIANAYDDKEGNVVADVIQVRFSLTHTNERRKHSQMLSCLAVSFCSTLMPLYFLQCRAHVATSLSDPEPMLWPRLSRWRPTRRWAMQMEKLPCGDSAQAWKDQMIPGEWKEQFDFERDMPRAQLVRYTISPGSNPPVAMRKCVLVVSVRLFLRVLFLSVLFLLSSSLCCRL